MSEELAARLMARIAVPPMPFAPDTYTAGRMDQFTEMITQLRALPEVDKERVLADAKARIEGLLENGHNTGSQDWYFNEGLREALAALTQPQTEIEGKPDGTWYDIPDGGGAATAAGVADADLEAAAMEISVKATRLDPETYKVPDKLIWMLRSALFPNEDMERIKSPGPYAKAFRERVCPVPEFPGIEKEES